ncbi:MAG TPA: hypothetical protein PK224_12725 [Nitrospira sp.]|nr:hypothetical protein [Nitrospira sp.]
MLTPVEIAALITATKGAVDIFDKVAGQVKSVLTKRSKEVAGDDDQWRYKIGSDAAATSIIVKQDNRVVQTLKGDELAKMLSPSDLRLIKTYESKMSEYYDLWEKVYEEKDASNDALANAKTEKQLNKLIAKMRDELLGILRFLEQIGVHLDDHYMQIRHLVQDVK